MNIDLLLELARGTERKAVSVTFIFVGGSHAARPAELDENRAAPSFRRRGWRSGNTAVEAIAAYMRSMEASCRILWLSCLPTIR